MRQHQSEQQLMKDSQINEEMSTDNASIVSEKKLEMKWVYMLMVFMLISGCANTIIFKVMDDTHIDGQTDPKYTYTHPYFQSSTMFFGQLMCLFVYGCIYRGKKASPQTPASPNTQLAQKLQLKTTNNPFILGAPAFFDYVGSTIMFVALGLVPASVYQMMRGFIVVITCIFAIILLKKKHYRHHWMGVGLVTGGIVMVGIAAGIWGHNEGESTTGGMIAGIIMLLVSQLFTACQFILQSKLLDKYYVHPMKLVGCQGLIGFSTSIIAMVIFSYIPCPGENFCARQYDTIEDPILAMKELFKPIGIIFCALGIIVSIAFFNFLGVSVTKYSSVSHRAVVDTSRTVVVWIFFLALGNQTFLVLQLGGFIVLTFGSLIFNEVLKLPCCGLNQYTSQKLEAKKRQQGLISGQDEDQQGVGRKQSTSKGPDYMSSSPGTYDANRLRNKLLKKYQQQRRSESGIAIDIQDNGALSSSHNNGGRSLSSYKRNGKSSMSRH